MLTDPEYAYHQSVERTPASGKQAGVIITTSLDGLRIQLAEVQARLDRHHASSLKSDNLACDIGGIRSRSAKAKNARWDRYSRDAARTVALCGQRDALEAQIARITSGRAEREANAAASARERVLSSAVGDTVINSAYGPVRVARVNRKGVTIETVSGYREARAWELIRDNVIAVQKAAR